MRRSTIALVVIAVVVIAIAFSLRSRSDQEALPDPTTTTAATTTVPSTDPDVSSTTSSTTTIESTTIASTLPPGVSACDLYGEIEQTGTITSTELVEASGMAASRTTPNVLWSHNDSRGEPTLYAFAPDGTDLGGVTVPGAFSIDWEDMGAGPGADGLGAYLYVGDIGDNFGIRDGLIYVWQVPDVDPGGLDGEFPTSTAITLQMPGGAHDAEALFIDPIDPSIYVVTKSRDEARVYRGPLTSGSAPAEMEQVATLFLDAEVSGADITADGSIIALRGYRTVWMWTRTGDQTIADALATQPCTAPSPDETQGESITFDVNGDYFTTSEGSTPPISRVPRSGG
jgi:hypothetical protein